VGKVSFDSFGATVQVKGTFIQRCQSYHLNFPFSSSSANDELVHINVIDSLSRIIVCDYSLFHQLSGFGINIPFVDSRVISIQEEHSP